MLIHALLHDVRGSLTSLMGWHSIIEMKDGDGSLQRPLGGLERSIAGLQEKVVLFAGTPDTTREVWRGDVAAMLRESGVVPVVSGEGHGGCWPGGLIAAIEAAAPESAEVLPVAGEGCEVRLRGVQAGAVELLRSPSSPEIIEAIDRRSRGWGALLIKESMRGLKGAAIRFPDATTIALFLP